MTLQARLIVVRDAIQVVLRHLDALPPSDRAGQLRLWVVECLEETERWHDAPPTDRQRDVLMKRLLALHVGVTGLERETVGASDGGRFMSESVV